MRVFRCTTYIPVPGGVTEPVTVILRDSDLNTTIEDVRMRTLDRNERGEFFIFDIFEMPDGPIEEATAWAISRVNPERENDQAVLWWWTLQAFKHCKEDGMVINPAPAPLSADEIEAVMEQLAVHPDRKQRKLTASSEYDNVILTLGADGKVVRQDV